MASYANFQLKQRDDSGNANLARNGGLESEMKLLLTLSCIISTASQIPTPVVCSIQRVINFVKHHALGILTDKD